jgi:predicted amidophosphoribosyltransferase
MHPFVTDISHFTIDTLFPKACLVCDEPNTFLCSRCSSEFAPVSHQICIVCTKPSLHGMTHERCKAPQSPEGLLAPFDYHDPRVADILVDAKYKFLPDVYTTLGKLLADFIRREGLHRYLEGYTVCPVPLSKQRLRWRGFNQAALMATVFSESLCLPYEQVLSRHKVTKTQKDLSKDARKHNMTNAFSLLHYARPWYEPILDKLFVYEKSLHLRESVAGKSFLLIDDVVTTGSTLLEATKVLKRNGAKSVWCVTVARD